MGLRPWFTRRRRAQTGLVATLKRKSNIKNHKFFGGPQLWLREPRPSPFVVMPKSPPGPARPRAKPSWRRMPSSTACLVPEDSALCETKPIEAAGSVCSVPARASREETPCGVTTNGDNDAKQSQSVTVEGGHSPSCEATKQSQLEEDVSSGAGLVPEDSALCETKPIEAAGAVCSMPARASREETPCGVTTNGDNDAKRSQSVAVEGGHSPPYKTAKQSQSAVVEGGQSPPDEAAKQSQSRRPADGAWTMPRVRARVACHYHNVDRSR